MSGDNPEDEKWWKKHLGTLITESARTLRWAMGGGIALLIGGVWWPDNGCEMPKFQIAASVTVLLFGALSSLIGIGGFVYGRSQSRFRERQVRELKLQIEDLTARLEEGSAS